MIDLKTSTLFRRSLLPIAFLLTSSSALADSDNVTWKPWLSTNRINMEIPTPAAEIDASELAELAKRTANLSEKQQTNVDYWQEANPNYRWTQMILSRYAKGPPSPFKGRGLALLNVAIYDAISVATQAQLTFKRSRPSGSLAGGRIKTEYSYPSAHASAAGAAAGVLAYLFPDEAEYFETMANLAAEAQIDGGAIYPSDATAGLDLGKKVAMNVLSYADNDGSDVKWNGTRPSGAGYLKGEVFVYPGVGDWKPWVIKSVDDYIPAPPPPVDSAEMDDQLSTLRDIERTVPMAIRAWTNHSTERAYQWWYEKIAEAVFENSNKLSIPQVALAYAAISTANHDAIIACFKAKYTYWLIRPAQLDPSLPALFPNPPHPSYPAAHSCSTMSFAVVIGNYFEQHQAAMNSAAEEAGYSRMIAGIHYPIDKEAGEVIGKGVASEAIKFANTLSSTH